MTDTPKLRCWPGCMALVIRGRNSGKQVHVLHFLGPATRGAILRVLHLGANYQVHVAHSEGQYWWVETKMLLEDANGKTSGVGAFPDHWLLPLTPPPKPETTTREKEHAHPA